MLDAFVLKQRFLYGFVLPTCAESVSATMFLGRHRLQMLTGNFGAILSKVAVDAIFTMEPSGSRLVAM